MLLKVGTSGCGIFWGNLSKPFTTPPPSAQTGGTAKLRSRFACKASDKPGHCPSRPAGAATVVYRVAAPAGSNNGKSRNGRGRSKEGAAGRVLGGRGRSPLPRDNQICHGVAMDSPCLPPAAGAVLAAHRSGHGRNINRVGGRAHHVQTGNGTGNIRCGVGKADAGTEKVGRGNIASVGRARQWGTLVVCNFHNHDISVCSVPSNRGAAKPKVRAANATRVLLGGRRRAPCPHAQHLPRPRTAI